MKAHHIHYYINDEYYDSGRFPYTFIGGKWSQNLEMPIPGDMIKGHYREIWKVLNISVTSETNISITYRFDIHGEDGEPFDYSC